MTTIQNADELDDILMTAKGSSLSVIANDGQPYIVFPAEGHGEASAQGMPFTDGEHDTMNPNNEWVEFKSESWWPIIVLDHENILSHRQAMESGRASGFPDRQMIVDALLAVRWSVPSVVGHKAQEEAGKYADAVLACLSDHAAESRNPEAASRP